MKKENLMDKNSSDKIVEFLTKENLFLLDKHITVE
jgi:hypothetical protein